MRFFTTAWHAGDMPDAAADAVPGAYAAHLRAIASQLTSGAQALAALVTLHDALIRRVTLDTSRGEVQLLLRAGDQQHGYEDIDLRYTEATLAPAAQAALQAAVEPPPSDLLYDEVDVVGPRRFVHRLLFWPYREVEVSWTDVAITRQPAAARNLAPGEPQWVQI